MPQVLILPVVDNKALVMVRVKRPVITDATLELPAGGVDEGESPREAARREFREETGLTVPNLRRFEMLPPLVHMPRSPCMPYIFRVSVTRDQFCRREPHDHEIESVECVDFGTILDMVTNGEIYVGLHVAIIMRFFLQDDAEALVSRTDHTREPSSHTATRGL
jgi:ADP-ribose pyrophosphatase